MGQCLDIWDKGHRMSNTSLDENPSVKKYFLVLDVFSVQQPELGVREIAHQLNIPSSTAGRIAIQLRDIGVLSQDQKTQKYRLNSRVLKWARVFQSTSKLRELGLPVLRQLNNSTGETATLTIPYGEFRMILERIESEHTMRYVVNPGDLMPLHSGASGKIFLAYMSELQRKLILSSTGLPPFTKNTITDPVLFEQELNKIAINGFAISRGERVADVVSAAAPVRDANGDVIASINVSGPTARIDENSLLKFADLVMSAAMQLSQSLGYYKPEM